MKKKTTHSHIFDENNKVCIAAAGVVAIVALLLYYCSFSVVSSRVVVESRVHCTNLMHVMSQCI